MAADQISRAVTPGSMAYGDRQQFASALSGAAGGGGPASGGVAGPSPSVTPGAGDPLGMLLGGGLPPRPGPATAGLSVGPGPGPAQSAVPDAMADRLRLVAANAKTPMLRAAARAALRRRMQ